MKIFSRADEMRKFLKMHEEFVEVFKRVLD